MSDTSPPRDLEARLADAEAQLATAERFQREQLAVLSRALAAAEEVEARAQRDAAAIIDRAHLDLSIIDEAGLTADEFVEFL